MLNFGMKMDTDPKFLERDPLIPGLEFAPVGPEWANYGIYCRKHFDNGWGVSVVCHSHSYGGRYISHCKETPLFELAVLDPNGHLHYKNPVTHRDVRGFLTIPEVLDLVAQVENFWIFPWVEGLVHEDAYEERSAALLL